MGSGRERRNTDEDVVREPDAAREGQAATDTKEEATDYNFIREQIQERPVNRRKLLRRMLLTAGLAVLFGLVACVTFLLLEPVIGRWISSDEEMALTVVSLPETTEEEEAVVDVEISDDEGEKIVARSVLQEDEEGGADQGPAAETAESVDAVAGEAIESIEVETPIESMALGDDETVSANASGPQAGSTAEAGSSSILTSGVAEAAGVTAQAQETAEAASEPVIVYERAELELEDYRQLYRGMYAMSREVSKSLVTITAMPEDADVLTDASALVQTVGLIVAQNGYELLILADSRSIASADTLQVAFSDGSTGSLSQKSADSDTGLAIYGIRLSSLSAQTREMAVEATATLGSSYATSILGNAVIAVGRPLGTASVCYGAVTSAARSFGVRDGAYQLLTTDISCSPQASGVIVNLRGQVVGIVCQDRAQEGMEHLLWAYGISSIRKLIENLTNDVARPYLGLRYSEVTAEVAEALGMPQGVYVTAVEMDSPAMNAGLSKGDVIQSIDGQQCYTSGEYMNALSGCEAGSVATVIYARMTGSGYRTVSVDVELGTRE